MANKQVNITLSLIDKMSEPLVKVADNMGKISSETRKATASVNRGAKKMEKSMDNLVKKSFKWAKRIGILAGGAAFTIGVKGTGDLQDGANKVKSIAREALELKEIQEGLLRVSTKLGGGITTTEVAGAQYQAISSGIDPKDSLAFTELAGKLRVAGFTDIESAIDLLTSTMNAFGLEKLEDAVKLADEFLYTQNKGVILVDEMAQYYGQLMPFFSTMNLGTEDMNIAIATLTKMGVKPAEAVTSTKALMKDLSGATPKAIKEAAAYGVELSAAALESRGFAGTMNEIIDATGGDVEKIMGIFPNVRSMIASLNLTSEKGVEIFKDVAEGMDESAGLVDEAYETLQNSLPKRLESIKMAFKNLWTKSFNVEGGIAEPIMEKLKKLDDFLRSDEGWEIMSEKIEKLSETLRKAYDWVVRVFTAISDNKDTIIQVVKTFLLFYGALKVVRGVQTGIQGISAAWTVFSNLIKGKLKIGFLGKFIAVMTVLLSILNYVSNNWDEIQEKYPTLTRFINWVEEKIQQLIENLPEIIDSVLKAIDTVMEIAEEIFGPIFEMLAWLIEKIALTISVAHAMFEGDWATALESFGALFGIEVDNVEETANKLEAFFDDPLEPLVSMITDKFKEGYEYVKEKWENLKGWFSDKLTATVEWKEEMKEKGGGSVIKGMFYNANPEFVPQRAVGDMNWKGGIVQVSEKGGEILDLPSGTRIYPHDDSVEKSFMDGVKMANANSTGNQTVNLPSINIYGNVYGEKDLMDKVGNELVATLEKYLPNMA